MNMARVFPYQSTHDARQVCRMRMGAACMLQRRRRRTASPIAAWRRLTGGSRERQTAAMRPLLPLLALLFPAAVHAQPAAEPCARHWEGAITLPTGPLAFDIDLVKRADGTCTGDVSILAQGARDVAIPDVMAAPTRCDSR